MLCVRLIAGSSEVEWVSPQYTTDSESEFDAQSVEMEVAELTDATESDESSDESEEAESFVELSNDDTRHLAPFTPYPELQLDEEVSAHLPPDRDAKAAAALMRLLQAIEPVAAAGATAKTSTTTVGGAANSATPPIRVTIKNDAPQPLPPGRQEISFLPGGEYRLLRSSGRSSGRSSTPRLV